MFTLTKEEKNNIFLAVIVNIAFAFSIFVFIPYEIYFANIVDFNFSLSKFWMPVVLGAIFFIGSMLVHILCLKKRIFKGYTGFLTGIMTAGYVQSMFFNGRMKTMDGTVEEWDIATKLVNVILWVIIVILVLIALKVFKKVWKDVCKFISIMIIGMQGVALISLLLTTEINTYDEVKITNNGLCEVAEENNVVIFCLDRCDQKYVDLMLNKFPDAMDNLNGFIYYPNATGKYCYTHVAVPYLLSGNLIPEYDPTDEQFCEQAESSDYLNYILDNVGNVGIYTNEYCIRSAETRDKIDNCVSVEYILRKKNTAIACIKASLYRILPFALKNNFEYSADTFNKNVEIVNAEIYNADSHETEAGMLKKLTEVGLVVNESYGESAFRFIHLKSTHNDYNLDENGNYQGANTSIEQCLAGDFVLIRKYCEELERLGLFESTTIIIVADHGNTRILQSGDDSEINVNPIFMYKPKGATRNEVFRTSLAPVAQDDIFATVLNSFGEDGGQYGFTIDDIYEGMERERFYYWCEQEPEVSDRESCIHVEYRINGDSRDIENWMRTGNQVYPNGSPQKAAESR